MPQNFSGGSWLTFVQVAARPLSAGVVVHYDKSVNVPVGQRAHLWEEKLSLKVAAATMGEPPTCTVAPLFPSNPTQHAPVWVPVGGMWQPVELPVVIQPGGVIYISGRFFQFTAEQVA